MTPAVLKMFLKKHFAVNYSYFEFEHLNIVWSQLGGRRSQMSIPWRFQKREKNKIAENVFIG